MKVLQKIPYLTKYLPPASVLGTYTDWNDVIYRDALNRTVDIGLFRRDREDTLLFWG